VDTTDRPHLSHPADGSGADEGTYPEEGTHPDDGSQPADGSDQSDETREPGAPTAGVDGARPDRLVADPTLAARFSRGRARPRGRRFVAIYPGAVVAAACLVALAVVVGVRALSADGSRAAASSGPAVAVISTGRPSVDPTPSAPVSSASGPASTPGSPSGPGATSGSATGTSSGSPTAPRSASSRPLTSPVQSGAPAPAALQALAGAALVRNPALRLAAQARRQLLAGLVDVRLSTVLATVAAQAALTVDSFQSLGGDPAGSPVRQATVSPTDPADRGAVTRALADQAGDYAVATAPAATAGLETVRLRTVTPG